MAATLCASVSPLQEMMDIVKAIYDMMGKYTYPVLREDTPRQHVDVFFQVSVHTLCVSFQFIIDQSAPKYLSGGLCPPWTTHCRKQKPMTSIVLQDEMVSLSRHQEGHVVEH